MATPQLPELPRVSGFIEPLTRFEADFATRVRETTKLEIPPGPASTALDVARSVEAERAPTPLRLPRVEEVLPAAPKLRELIPKVVPPEAAAPPAPSAAPPVAPPPAAPPEPPEAVPVEAQAPIESESEAIPIE